MELNVLTRHGELSKAQRIETVPADLYGNSIATLMIVLLHALKMKRSIEVSKYDMKFSDHSNPQPFSASM